jgi:uncharacterized integral membrane protein (TIGR00697 family)
LDSSRPNSDIILKHKAVAIYLLLGGLFISFLIVCNLIANKFIEIPVFFRDKPFVVSCGILPYPVTFLITDLLSEFYGRRRTAWVVITGLISSVFIVFLIRWAATFPAVSISPASTEAFNEIFGNSWRVIGASMIAYLSAQLLDVQIYEFWRKVTKGKYLWIRNNGSTIVSQLVDSILVVLVLFLGTLSFGEIQTLILDGWQFKVLCALIDTPFIYLFVYLIRKYFKLQPGEEVQF